MPESPADPTPPDEPPPTSDDPDVDAFCTWLVRVLIEALSDKLELARRAHAVPDAEDARRVGSDETP